MEDQKQLLSKYSIEDLDRELIARGAARPNEKLFNFFEEEGTPARENIMVKTRELYIPNKTLSQEKALNHIDIWELVEALLRRLKKGEEKDKGLWGDDRRMDVFQITNEQILHNANCVAAICMKHDLIENGNGRFTLRHKRFGDTFNLCCAEHFYDQPIAAGRICTGFIVKEDVMVTAGHCVYKKNLSDLRIVFGYNKSDFEKPATQVSNNKIYKAKKVIHIVYDPEGTGADWALVKLDRKVKGQGVVTLSPKNISLEKQVYTLGHPCGLPLKYARGAYVRDMSKAFFSSDLSVYSGNSGSPVFNYDTHEVVGIVARGDSQDFRWTGRGWLSITYPCRGFRSKAPQCTKVSEFSDYL